MQFVLHVYLIVILFQSYHNCNRGVVFFVEGQNNILDFFYLANSPESR